MAVEILFDAELERACFFCNTEGRPFGPAFFIASRDDAYGFLHFLEVDQGQDPRKLEADVLHTLFRLWESEEKAKERSAWASWAVATLPLQEDVEKELHQTASSGGPIPDSVKAQVEEAQIKKYRTIRDTTP